LAIRVTISFSRTLIHGVIYVHLFLVGVAQSRGWTTGVRVPAEEQKEIFTFAPESGLALGPTQPSIQWVTEALSPGVKLQERESDRSPASTAEVKNAWSYASTPPYDFNACCLIKHRGNSFYGQRKLHSLP